MSLIFVTFIFRLAITPEQTYYGKYYTDTISPDHEGIDAEVRPYLLRGINGYMKLEHNTEVEIKEKVHIGIMSVCNHKYISIHSSDEERDCFDFYCEKFTINHKPCLKMYMFGKLIENPVF
jgi:hypothetical protein